MNLQDGKVHHVLIQSVLLKVDMDYMAARFFDCKTCKEVEAGITTKETTVVLCNFHLLLDSLLLPLQQGRNHY